MLKEDSLIPIEYEDDPERCKGVERREQCKFKAEPETIYCKKHQGISRVANEKARISNYRIARYQQRLDELANHDQLKSLRDEIALLRMMLEEIINRCVSMNQLLVAHPKILDLTRSIERLVVSCHKIEVSTGFYLSKPQVINMAVMIGDIVGRFVTDPEDLELINAQMEEVILNDGEITVHLNGRTPYQENPMGS